MPTLDTTALRAVLTTKLAQVRAAAAMLDEPIETARAGGNDANDDPDASVYHQETEALISRRARLRRDERDLVDALERLERGELGTCEGCGEQISPARLKAMPATPYCIECALDLEQRAERVLA